MRIFAVTTLLTVPTLGMAEEFVTDPAFCGKDVFEIVDAGQMVMTPTTLEGAEYYCERNAPVMPVAGVDSNETRTGICSTSDMIFPKVFAFVTDAGIEDSIRYYESDGDGAATVFYACL